MSQNSTAGIPLQPEKIESIENEDGITIGESYLVRRADSSVCQAQVIQARMSEFGYFEYYVHYVGLNRRLDQWVQRSQLLSSSSPESLESPQTIRVSTDAPSLDPLTDDSSDRKITRNQKRRHDEINHVQKTYAEMDPTTGKVLFGRSDFDDYQAVELMNFCLLLVLSEARWLKYFFFFSNVIHLQIGKK